MHKRFKMNILGSSFYILQSSDSFGWSWVDTDSGLTQVHFTTCVL